MTRTRTFLAIAAICFAAPAAAQTPWEVIQGVELRETGTDADWAVEKTFPPGYENGADRFAIDGYAVVYAAQADLREIILVPDASQCPFCGGDQGYGPTLEVVFDRPVEIDAPELRIHVEGRLEAVRDADTFQAFRLTGARLIDAPT